MNDLTISSPKNLFAFLNRLEKKPSKSLSQNFLVDQNIIQKMVALANLSIDDLIIEIGPGAGAITEALLNQGHKVIAIEKDSKLAMGLKEQFTSKNLTVIEGDILEIDLTKMVPPNKKIKIISNLPFQITSLILGKLLPFYEIIDTLTLIMQKDVLDRILAKPGSKMISSLSIFTHFHAEAKHLFDIAPTCFFPKPRVTSACFQLILKKPVLENGLEFIEFVRKGYNQRRKMLSSSLPFPSEQIQIALKELKLLPLSRPENLTLNHWIGLFKNLCSTSLAH